SIATVQTSINNARAANPTNVIVVKLLSNATYTVSTASLTLGSHECLVIGSAKIHAASTNVSVAGGTLDALGANVNGIYAPQAARVNVDRVIVRNCGQDCILLKGNGNSIWDNEMTVTRC